MQHTRARNVAQPWIVVGGILARINVEDSLFKDNRFFKLAQKIGGLDAALGAIVRAWSLAQKWYLTPERMIPMSEWRDQEISDLIIDVGLAEKIGEKIRIKGADQQFAWLLQRSDAGKTGGINSGVARREIIKESAKRSQAEPSGAKPLTLSPSPSLSLTHSLTQKKIKHVTKR